MTVVEASQRPHRGWRYLGFVVAVFVLGFDQWAKHWARTSLGALGHSFWGGVLRLRLVSNHGAFAGLGAQAAAWLRWPLVLGGLALTLWLGLWSFRSRHNWRLAAGLGALLGGVLANTVDRLCFGYVTDFIGFYFVAWFGVGTLNPADLAILAGLALLVPSVMGRQ